jgi:D-threo-aldose 1-dehydrogenase
VGDVTPARDWRAPRALGRRGPHVTGLGLGTAPIGNMFSGVRDRDARATVDAAWDAGIRYFDTAPFYGYGAAERRLGHALKARKRDEYVLATKVGRVLDPAGAGTERAPTIFRDVGDVEPRFDYSRDGVLRSIDESLTRLGTDRIDVALVHDPDLHEDDALAHAFPALVDLREQGVVRAVGCGMNQFQMLSRFVARVDLDCVLLAGRYSLLDRGGAGLLAQCAERGVGVVLGGVFNTGVLVDPDVHQTYDYAPASSDVLARARRLRDACAAHGIALGAAALQFTLRHPAVSTVLVGARSAAEIDLDVEFAAARIDDDTLRDIAQTA